MPARQSERDNRAIGWPSFLCQYLYESDSAVLTQTNDTKGNTLLIVVAAAFLTGIFVLLLGLNMRRGLNHDEHQFVASGALIARHGLFPYVDFAYFHVPGLSFLYALIFKFNDRLLLSARLVSIVSSWGTLVLLFAVGFTILRSQPVWLRLLTAGSVVVLLLSNPFFIHASGRAWNHDVPILLTLVALLMYIHGLAPARSAFWFILSGLLIGLAASVRLSFAAVAAPFLAALWFHRDHESRLRRHALAAFAIGGIVGTLPLVVMFALAPATFLFDNLGYVRLNTQFYQHAQPGHITMSLGGKFLYFGQLVLQQPGTIAFALVCLALAVPALSSFSLTAARRMALTLLLLPFLLLGALAPTPAQVQYFFVLFPFLALLMLYALDQWPARRQHIGVSMLSIAAIVSALFAVPEYAAGLEIVSTPAEWFPVKTHERGTYVDDLATHEPVLTLAPIYPLEGGANIYDEFATGPFAWRVAPLMEAEARQRYSIVAAGDLNAYLQDQQPRAILITVDDNDTGEEQPLTDFAKTHNYVPVDVTEVGTLWLSPLVEWDRKIQLGGYTLPAAPLQAGDSFVATFFLQNIAPIERNLNVLVQIVDHEGQELLRDEGWPWGAPTSTWERGDVWPDGHDLTIPPEAPSGYYRVDLSFYDPDTLDPVGDTYTVDFIRVGATSPPATAASTPVLGERIRLIEPGIQPKTLQPGSTFSVHLTWQSIKPIEKDYTVFVHLIGPDGALVTQQDTQPLGGFFPTSFWRTGQPVTDSYTLSVPADAPAGTYEVRAGMYDSTTGKRLTVPDDIDVGHDAVILAKITIN